MKIISPITKKTLALYLIVSFVSLFSYLLLLSPTAKAESYEWQGDKITRANDNPSTDGKTEEFFKQGKHDGNLYSFSTLDTVDGDPPRCESHIDITIGAGPNIGKYYEGYLPSADTPCTWREAATIQISNQQAGDKNLNKDLGLKECPNGPSGKAKDTANYNCLGGGAVINGKFDKNGTVDQKNPDSEENPDANAEDTDTACSDALTPFGWVMCPLLSLADNIYGFMVGVINDLLFFESGLYDTNEVKDAWRVFANLASAIIVLIALVMIAAQIFNFEVFNAYTVKKVLPRIVIAAILIQLSWFLFSAMIQIVNAIGTGLYWLLLAPFPNYNDNNGGGTFVSITDIIQGGNEGGGGGEVAGNIFGTVLSGGGLVLGAVAIKGAWVSLILMAVGVIISIAVALFTLIVRQAILIILLVISPLAIAFWILPGTNKFWNMWWSNFSKLLIMYPLIMLLFAAGAIAAIILSGAG